MSQLADEILTMPENEVTTVCASCGNKPSDPKQQFQYCGYCKDNANEFGVCGQCLKTGGSWTMGEHFKSHFKTK